MATRSVAPTRAEQKAATRRAILEAALEVFAERGFEGATMREVAERADVKQPLIVYHFDNKDVLWQAAVDAVWARLEARVAEGVGGTAARFASSFEPGSARPDVMRQFIASVLRAFASEPAYIRIVLREAGTDGDRYAWLAQRHMDRNFQDFLGVLTLARSAGFVPEGVRLEHMIYAFAGALFFPFAVAADVRRQLGLDPADDAFIEAHADTLVAMFSIARERDEP